LTRDHRDPILLYDLAAGKLSEIRDRTCAGGPSPEPSPDFSQSRQTLQGFHLMDECISRFGHCEVFDYCVSYKALVMRAGKRWSDLRQMLHDFQENNPDNRIYATSLTWMGEACLNMDRREDAERFFRQALLSWPPNSATQQAGLHLAEMVGADAIFDEAKGLLASGSYREAYSFYRALAFSADKKTADKSILSLAYCSFYINRFQEASNLFLQWLNDNLDAPESAKVQADLIQCNAIIAQYKEWRAGPYPNPASPERSGLVVRFLKWTSRKLHQIM
jgi:tetratricopeptide (TPR) repeat protein